jgi:hypothetical protein
VTTQGSESLLKMNAAFLQNGKVTVPLSNDLKIYVSGTEYKDFYLISSSAIMSLIVSVPFEGSYSIETVSDAKSGHLETTESVSNIVVDCRDHLLQRLFSFHSLQRIRLLLQRRHSRPQRVFQLPPIAFSFEENILLRIICFVFVTLDLISDNFAVK